MTTAGICYPDSTDWSCIPATVLDEMDPDMKERAEALAWSTLSGLTGHFFDTCPITVRPCRKSCSSDWRGWTVAPPYSGGGVFNPHIGLEGYWVNSCGCGQDPCSCGPIHEILLPGPVGGGLTVTIDGGVLDRSAYRVDNGNRLVRQDGSDWPVCQDMNKPGGVTYEPIVVENVSNRITYTREGQMVHMLVEPRTGGGGFGSAPWTVRSAGTTNLYNAGGSQVGTLSLNKGAKNISGSAGPGFVAFQLAYETTDSADPVDMTDTFLVTYYRGTGPNALLDYAAGVLAWEFYQACSGNDCRLPAGVTSVTRQGISFQMQTGLFQNGFTGIREVDAVVGLYNPNGLKAPPYISSPDVRPGRITTYGG